MEETYLKETIKEGENGPQTTLLRYLHWLLRSKVWSYLNIALTLVHVVSVWKYNCIFYNRMWHTLHSTIAIFMMTYDSTNENVIIWISLVRVVSHINSNISWQRICIGPLGTPCHQSFDLWLTHWPVIYHHQLPTGWWKISLIYH